MKRFLGSALILLLVLAGCVAPVTTPPAAGDAATATGEAAASKGAAGQGAITLRDGPIHRRRQERRRREA